MIVLKHRPAGSLSGQRGVAADESLSSAYYSPGADRQSGSQRDKM